MAYIYLNAPLPFYHYSSSLLHYTLIFQVSDVRSLREFGIDENLEVVLFKDGVPTGIKNTRFTALGLCTSNAGRSFKFYWMKVLKAPFFVFIFLMTVVFCMIHSIEIQKSPSVRVTEPRIRFFGQKPDPKHWRKPFCSYYTHHRHFVIRFLSSHIDFFLAHMTAWRQKLQLNVLQVWVWHVFRPILSSYDIYYNLFSCLNYFVFGPWNLHEMET